MTNELVKRDVAVVAMSQEDVDLEAFAKMPGRFDPPLPFDVVGDINGKDTPNYDRVTAYFIDDEGVVRQIFPMIIHARPSWKTILGEVDRILASDKKAEEAGAPAKGSGSR